jgi:hypothetical protein
MISIWFVICSADTAVPVSRILLLWRQDIVMEAFSNQDREGFYFHWSQVGYCEARSCSSSKWCEPVASSIQTLQDSVLSLHASFVSVHVLPLSVADPDPGSGASLNPWPGMIKKSRSGIREFGNNSFGLKYLNSLMCSGSGIQNLLDPGSGIQNLFYPESGIREAKNSDLGSGLSRIRNTASSSSAPFWAPNAS